MNADDQVGLPGNHEFDRLDPLTTATAPESGRLCPAPFLHLQRSVLSLRLGNCPEY